MLIIKAINNNKNSVRVYNHAAKYSKSDLLAYANNVNNALFADIRMKNGYSILTHKIDKNGGKIRHNAPDKKRHKIFVDRCVDNADIFGVDPETITENNAVKIYDILQSFYNSRIVTERETIAVILTELTPLNWCADTIRGYCQSEWNYIVYPETYSSNTILDFETFYFGKYKDYIIEYRGETICDFIPDHIAWNENELTTRILELTRDYLTSDENISAADIVYNFDV